VRHSYAVIDSLQDQFAGMTKAEAAHRSFLLTGDPSYLKAYRDAAAEAFSDVTRFHQMSNEAPVHIRLDSRFSELVVSKSEMMERDVEFAEQHGPDGGIALMRAKAGDKAMDAIRVETLSLMDRQQTILLDQEHQAAQSEQIAILVVSLSCGLRFSGSRSRSAPSWSRPSGATGATAASSSNARPRGTKAAPSRRSSPIPATSSGRRSTPSLAFPSCCWKSISANCRPSSATTSSRSATPART
jgi:CHASE3 domain sensor protein